MSDVIDATAEDLTLEQVANAAAGAALVARPASLAVTPNVQAGELVARLDVIREAMHDAMREGVDYGRIPGVDKPTLLKPGAEKLGVLFQLDVQLASEKTWGPGEHLTVETKATVYHAPTGARLGYGEGMCSTREKKYGKRRQDRECPQCDAAAIKRSKYPPRENPSAEPGWYCFAKIGGCGANFAADDPRIVDQATGDIENPELPDTWNTVVKMAAKRARVDAVLAVTGASALFTQDVEDDHAPVEPAPPSNAEQVARVKALVRSRKVRTDELRTVLRDALVPTGANPVPVVDALTVEQAAAVADALEHRPVPTGESDVTGAAPGEFQHPPAQPTLTEAGSTA